MDRWILLGVFLLTVACILRFVTIKKWSLTEKFLITALISLLINTIVLYFSFTENYKPLATLYRFGTLSIFIFLPSCFLYLKYSLANGRLKWVDLVLFLPALVFMFDYLPFFLSSNGYKMNAMLKDFNDGTGHLHLQSHFMPPGVYFFIQNSIGLFGSVYLIFMIPHYIRLGGKSFYNDNKALIFWNSLIALFLFLTAIPDFLFSVTGKRFDFKSFTYITPCLFLYLFFPLSVIISPKSYRSIKGFWINSLKPAHIFTISEFSSEKEVQDILGYSMQLINASKVADRTPFSLPGALSNRQYVSDRQASEINAQLKAAIIKYKVYNKITVSLDEMAQLSQLPVSSINQFLDESVKMDLNAFIQSQKPN